MAQIFLSYSREDIEAAKALASALNERGHSVWWDKHISGGLKFAAEIEQALTAADIVMVLWSRTSINSAWVLDEAAEGRDTGRLLPVALDDCKPPLGFRQYQTIAAGGARLPSAMDDILQAIARKMGEEQEVAAATDPNSIEAHCARASYLQEEGEYDKARQQIDAALAMDPESWEANRQAGHLLYLQGQPADAIAFYEKAVAGTKDDHDSAAMLVSCYRATGDAAGLRRSAEIAVARGEHVVASNPRDGAAYASAAKALAALGHKERARKWIRKALNVDPGNLSMRYNLATTLAAFLDDAEAAIDLLEALVEATSKRAHVQRLQTDPNWSEIRDLPAFRQLVARAIRRVQALEATGDAERRSDAAQAPLFGSVHAIPSPDAHASGGTQGDGIEPAL